MSEMHNHEGLLPDNQNPTVLLPYLPIVTDGGKRTNESLGGRAGEFFELQLPEMYQEYADANLEQVRTRWREWNEHIIGPIILSASEWLEYHPNSYAKGESQASIEFTIAYPKDEGGTEPRPVRLGLNASDNGRAAEAQTRYVHFQKLAGNLSGVRPVSQLPIPLGMRERYEPQRVTIGRTRWLGRPIIELGLDVDSLRQCIVQAKRDTAAAVKIDSVDATVEPQSTLGTDTTIYDPDDPEKGMRIVSPYARLERSSLDMIIYNLSAQDLRRAADHVLDTEQARNLIKAAVAHRTERITRRERIADVKLLPAIRKSEEFRRLVQL